MEFLLQPGVYRTGDASTLLKLLDNMWIKDHSVGAGTLYIISGFANYNGGVRFYPYFTRHVQSGGKIVAYIGGSTAQRLSSIQVVEALLECGAEVNVVNRKRLLHAKCYGYKTPDDEELVVTSGNFTGPGMSQNAEAVEKEMKELTASYQADKLEFIKNPVIAEFLGLSSNTDFTESDLEQRIITHIQKFLMELGKGYAFVARQQHIRTEKEDYYIDLVFYNYILKCFVLIDLKTSKITHQDVGQMDMYIRMYDEMKRNEGDNPTLGIILCSDTDEDIAKYSILHGHEQLFASKYKTCLPSEEQLREEIEIQKRFYYLQKEEDKENKDF